jgi:DNA replication protein DnaD
LECEFEQVDSVDELKDWPYETGVIIEYPNTQFEYYDTSIDMNSLKPGYVNICCWKLIKYSVVRVYKDEEFINTKLNELGKVWDKIEEYQANKAVYDKEITSTNKEKETTYKSNIKLSGYSFI